jgi:hypothetical protein
MSNFKLLNNLTKTNIMKTRKKNYIFLLSFLCLQLVGFAQNIKELHGKVVETVNGKTLGIGNIMVTVNKDFSYKITDPNGDFSIPIPTDKDHVKITLENTSRQLINPYSGVVDLPASNKVEILVCAQENTRLRGEVEKLNQKVKSFQVKYELSNKKAALTYKEMLDTILHYEKRIQALDAQKDAIIAQFASQTEQFKAETKRLQTEIDRLKLVEESLMKQLLDAKDEKYKLKQAHFQKITAGLRRYVDELQNLNDMLLPDRINHYFTYDNRVANEKLSEKIKAYNLAYHEIDDNKDANLTAVRHYWEDASFAQQLKDTYQYLLTDVHEKTVYPMEFTVIETIKKASSSEIGMQKAKKIVKKSVLDSISTIKVKKTLLINKINDIINQLNQNF